MKQSQFVLDAQESERPKCERCGALMWLARIDPDEPSYERRTFECPECDHSMAWVVKYK